MPDQNSKIAFIESQFASEPKVVDTAQRVQVTKEDLNIIRSVAIQDYIASNYNGLDQHEVITRAWINAINKRLKLNIVFEFPKGPQAYESDDES